MENLLRVSIVLYLLQVIVCFKYDPGCISTDKLELERNEYDKVGWPWSEVHIRAWVPESAKTELLDIRLGYKDLPDVDNENIMIFTNRTLLTSSYQKKKNETKEPHEILIQSSWAGFLFRIDSHFMGIYKLESHQELFQLQLRKDIESIEIKGSNLTINCEQDYPIWWIINSDIIIPMDTSTNVYNFILYATRPFSPALSYNKMGSDIVLGLSNSTKEISHVHADAYLPPHTPHYISTNWKYDSDCKCYRCEILNSKNKTVHHYMLPDAPKYIRVSKSKKNSEDFFVTIYNQTNTKIQETPENWFNEFVVTLVLLCLIILMVISILGFLAFKYKKAVSTLNLINQEEHSNKKITELLVQLGQEMSICCNVSTPCIPNITSIKKTTDVTGINESTDAPDTTDSYIDTSNNTGNDSTGQTYLDKTNERSQQGDLVEVSYQSGIAADEHRLSSPEKDDNLQKNPSSDKQKHDPTSLESNSMANENVNDRDNANGSINESFGDTLDVQVVKNETDVLDDSLSSVSMNESMVGVSVDTPEKNRLSKDLLELDPLSTSTPNPKDPKSSINNELPENSETTEMQLLHQKNKTSNDPSKTVSKVETEHDLNFTSSTLPKRSHSGKDEIERHSNFRSSTLLSRSHSENMYLTPLKKTSPKRKISHKGSTEEKSHLMT